MRIEQIETVRTESERRRRSQSNKERGRGVGVGVGEARRRSRLISWSSVAIRGGTGGRHHQEQVRKTRKGRREENKGSMENRSQGEYEREVPTFKVR